MDTRFNQEMLQKGKYGWYFDKNTESVVRIIDQSEGSPEKMQLLRNRSREGLTQKYNWDAVTDEYETVFRTLCMRKISESVLRIDG